MVFFCNARYAGLTGHYVPWQTMSLWLVFYWNNHKIHGFSSKWMRVNSLCYKSYTHTARYNYRISDIQVKNTVLLKGSRAYTVKMERQGISKRGQGKRLG